MKVAQIMNGARVISPGRKEYHPKISIVTPTFCRNAEGLLTACLESAVMHCPAFAWII